MQERPSSQVGNRQANDDLLGISGRKNLILKPSSARGNRKISVGNIDTI